MESDISFSDCLLLRGGHAHALAGRLGRRVSNHVALDLLAHCDALTELFHGVLAFDLLKLGWRVLVQELVDAQVATTHSDVNLIFVNLNDDALGTELVDALRLAHEQNLKLLAVGVVIDVLGDLLVYLVVLDWDIDCDPRFQVNNVVLKCIDLSVQMLILN